MGSSLESDEQRPLVGDPARIMGTALSRQSNMRSYSGLWQTVKSIILRVTGELKLILAVNEPILHISGAVVYNDE